jgi:predicted transposase YdaD
LRVDKSSALELFKGARAMRDSVTYQAIVEEGVEKGIKKGLEQGLEQGLEMGRLDEARRLILRMGRRYLGPASKRVVAAIEKIADVARLEELAERVAEVKSWKELLATE